MTLTELKYVVAVAKRLHFGKAAESCFVSQPTLSIGIKKLEEELGAVLFEREGGIRLTAVGKLVEAQARFTLDQANMIKEIARSGKSGQSYVSPSYSFSLSVQ